MNSMLHAFSRTEMLIGAEALQKLKTARWRYSGLAEWAVLQWKLLPGQA